jgi:hypothetical protein
MAKPTVYTESEKAAPSLRERRRRMEELVSTLDVESDGFEDLRQVSYQSSAMTLMWLLTLYYAAPTPGPVDNLFS